MSVIQACGALGSSRGVVVVVIVIMVIVSNCVVVTDDRDSDRRDRVCIHDYCSM